MEAPRNPVDEGATPEIMRTLRESATMGFLLKVAPVSVLMGIQQESLDKLIDTASQTDAFGDDDTEARYGGAVVTALILRTVTALELCRRFNLDPPLAVRQAITQALREAALASTDISKKIGEILRLLFHSR